jgi:hypothetical protein
VDYNLKVVWITTSDSVENAYLLHSDVILQIQARWITQKAHRSPHKRLAENVSRQHFDLEIRLTVGMGLGVTLSTDLFIFSTFFKLECSSPDPVSVLPTSRVDALYRCAHLMNVVQCNIQYNDAPSSSANMLIHQ